MNLHQLRYVRETARRDFNLTMVAEALFTSQPGVSKAIIEFEQELGFQIFVRKGKRITGLTPPGGLVLETIERALTEIENLRRIADDFAAEDQGSLVISTTATQARYALPSAVSQFKKLFPAVRLTLLQGDPPQVARDVETGRADIGIATEYLSDSSELVTLPLYQWRHAVIVPHGHALSTQQTVSLDELAGYPLVTYEAAFSGRGRIDAAFARRRLVPQIVLEAIDSDVIKTYVELGLGVGIISRLAIDAARDSQLHSIDVGDLFGSNVTRVAIRRGAYLRDYAVKFLHLLTPVLTRDRLESAMRRPPGDAGPEYEL
ncbi:CysB family HTH-type transcriptional regulator [soil metagenome]